MVRILSVVFVTVLLSVTNLYAQFRLGDVRFQSFDQLFNPENKTLWKQKNERGLHEFKVQTSDIWTREGYSRLLISEDKNNSATFMTKEKHSEKFWKEKILHPLNKQFGNYEIKKRHNPFMIGKGQKTSMHRWIHTENNSTYYIWFYNVGKLKGILVFLHEDDN